MWGAHASRVLVVASRDDDLSSSLCSSTIALRSEVGESGRAYKIHGPQIYTDETQVLLRCGALWAARTPNSAPPRRRGLRPRRARSPDRRLTKPLRRLGSIAPTSHISQSATVLTARYGQ